MHFLRFISKWAITANGECHTHRKFYYEELEFVQRCDNEYCYKTMHSCNILWSGQTLYWCSLWWWIAGQLPGLTPTLPGVLPGFSFAGTPVCNNAIKLLTELFNFKLERYAYIMCDICSLQLYLACHCKLWHNRFLSIYLILFISWTWSLILGWYITFKLVRLYFWSLKVLY